jgi:hypothetical protein
MIKLVSILGTTQSCILFFGRAPPKTIENCNIVVHTEADRIIIKIQTRYNPNIYRGGVERIILGDNLISNKYLTFRFSEIKHYVYEDMFVIEFLDIQEVSTYLAGFNWISVWLNRGRIIEEYVYESEDFIFLCIDNIQKTEL